MRDNEPSTTSAEVSRVVGGGDANAMRALLARLVAEKLAIQLQLSDSKATSTTDPAWRGRAIHALGTKDKQIAQIKAALARVAPGGRIRGGERKMAERQAVAFLFGKADVLEVAEKVQTWLDDGWSALLTIPHPEGAIVVFRKDYDA